jgi:hypothetical protein
LNRNRDNLANDISPFNPNKSEEPTTTCSRKGKKKKKNNIERIKLFGRMKQKHLTVQDVDKILLDVGSGED